MNVQKPLNCCIKLPYPGSQIINIWLPNQTLGKMLPNTCTVGSVTSSYLKNFNHQFTQPGKPKDRRYMSMNLPHLMIMLQSRFLDGENYETKQEKKVKIKAQM